MSVSYGPNLGKMINAGTGDAFDIDFRAFLRMIDALLQGSVKSQSLSAPPSSPANGDRYIIGASPSGAWAGAAGSIACWTTDDPAASSGEWNIYAPKAGWLVYSVADAAFYSWTGSAWAAFSGGGGSGVASLNSLTGALSIAAGSNITVTPSGSTITIAASGGGGGGSSTLAGDSDVAISSPSDGQVLTYDATSRKWANATPSGGGGGGALPGPDVPPSTAGSLDDEFNGSALDGTRWTWLNQQAATATEGQGNLSLVNGTPSTGVNAILQAAPGSTPWEFTAKVCPHSPGSVTECGTILQESASGKLIIFGFEVTTGGLNLGIYAWNSPTSYGPVETSVVLSALTFTAPIYLKIKNDGTNLIFSLSYDGIIFDQFYQQTLAAFFTTAPDHVGLALVPFTQPVSMVCDWFRRTL